MQRQSLRLRQWARSQGIQEPLLITDLGSGLNDRKRGLLRLLRMICQEQVSTLVIVQSDRLLRFGYHLLSAVCTCHGTEIVVLDAPQQRSFEQELAEDVITLMTCTCARLYGKRSHQNKRHLTTS